MGQDFDPDVAVTATDSDTSNFESSLADVADSWQELKARRKVDLTVLPLLFLGLFVFQLDRMNLASALTAGFAQDIGINQATINLGNQLMFTGIVVIEIPSNMLLQKVGPRIYMTVQVLLFGLVATLQCVVKNRTGFLVLKSFLGLAEAGYIPGAIFTLSTWYTRRELAKRVAIFFFGMFGGNALSPLIASGIINLNGRRGLSGWQWIFLLEGIFTIFVAFVMLALLPGSPESPKPLFFRGLISLSPEEAYILRQRKAREYPDGQYRSQEIVITPQKVWETVCQWRRWPHFLATSLIFSTWSPLTIYTPSIMVSLGFDRVAANALASVGPLLALPIVFFFAFLSDKSNRRGFTVVLAATCYLISLIVIRTTEAKVGKWSRWGLWTAVNAFAVGYHPVHNTWVQLNCKDPAERSVGIAMWVMFSIGGMMYGSQYFQGKDAPLYLDGLLIMISVVSAAIGLFILQIGVYSACNRKSLRESEQAAEATKHQYMWTL